MLSTAKGQKSTIEAYGAAMAQISYGMCPKLRHTMMEWWHHCHYLTKLFERNMNYLELMGSGMRLHELILN